MPIRYPAILEMAERNQELSYSEEQTMLYALAVGMGADPLDETELAFIYEKGLKALPALASMVAWHAMPSIRQLGLDHSRVLHGAEEITLHRPMPAAAQLIADTVIPAVYDKGPARGAIVIRETRLRCARDGQPLATVRKTFLARGDGGFGGPSLSTPSLDAVPARPADSTIDLPIRADQAALFRLCGDRNPLHIDPQAARAAGFPAPILHGLCTYGFTCRAVLKSFGCNDVNVIESHAARFVAPIYPGETLRIEMWRDGETVSFRGSASARGDQTVVHGKTVLRTWCSKADVTSPRTSG